MNKFRFTVKDLDTQINLPIEINFDNVGREDLIRQFEDDVIEEIINPTEDFETTRYSHKVWYDTSNNPKYSTTYQFYFFDRSMNVANTTAANTNLWVSNYNFIDSSVYPNYSGMTFNNKEIYYYSNAFKRSFFKLDFYDTKEIENQKLYFTIIIPVQQGRKETVDIGTQSVPNEVQIRVPSFDLNFTGDKEGYFIYWLKSREYIANNTFYMSAKFYNAKVGEFIRMTNRPQSQMPNKFNFNKEDFFYYKVDLDVNSYEYELFNVHGAQNRVGQINSGIKWFEYVNPQ